MSSVNVGVVAIGDISEVYFDNVEKHPIVNVLRCTGSDPTRSIEKARRNRITRSHANANELLADADIDIVLNLIVPQAHDPLTSAALRAGKRVYTKKPLGITPRRRYCRGGESMQADATWDARLTPFRGGRSYTKTSSAKDGQV
ncbi:Gfo/Idh/MocA family oxidoreductase [Paraburkholderia sp. J8-2]|uniref:Gfo/Idh/MocA family oxidoreductase n=1 Tax=Paraburkholderia sp. J8-2 TaxID=2805440 RepID=UPI002AB6796B|nr:Gfo/Idh/MocA family oxidoreductase [Paraburkholderia sp. J8-2]